MEYTFASRRQLSFIIQAGGLNLLVEFGPRNQAGVSVFMTSDPKVAHAVRKHSLTRRGIIEETTKEVEIKAEVKAEKKAVAKAKAEAEAQPQRTVQAKKSAKAAADKAATTKPAEPKKPAEAKECIFDNYTVAREAICKELGIKKGDVRNPEALATVAKEHGIIIKYKEM
jgi:hypothetical protein